MTAQLQLPTLQLAPAQKLLLDQDRPADAASGEVGRDERLELCGQAVKATSEALKH